MKYLSQSLNISGQPIEGPLQGITTIGDIINKLLLIAIPLAGIILLLVLIWGGYDFIMSQGNAEKVKSAQAKITTGIIGFVLLVFSYLIIKVIEKIFGLETGIL